MRRRDAPYMAQGAVQSSEDVAVIANALNWPMSTMGCCSGALRADAQGSRVPLPGRLAPQWHVYHLADVRIDETATLTWRRPRLPSYLRTHGSTATMSRPNSSVGETANVLVVEPRGTSLAVAAIQWNVN